MFTEVPGVFLYLIELNTETILKFSVTVFSYRLHDLLHKDCPENYSSVGPSVRKRPQRPFVFVRTVVYTVSEKLGQQSLTLYLVK